MANETLNQWDQATAKPTAFSLVAARDPSLSSPQSRAFTLFLTMQSIRDAGVVEDTTLNDPTALSPTLGQSWVVAASPTGAWAGQATKIASRNTATATWEFAAPAEGWTVYDKAQNAIYRFDGSAWAKLPSDGIGYDNAISGLAATDVKAAIDELQTEKNYLASYAKASLPSASPAGQQIYVTDEVGGAIPAFSDGTNWRRVTDRAVVS